MSYSGGHDILLRVLYLSQIIYAKSLRARHWSRRKEMVFVFLLLEFADETVLGDAFAVQGTVLLHQSQQVLPGAVVP